MRLILLLSIFFTFISASYSLPMAEIVEEVYVESPTDTDQDGKLDLIYVQIKRPNVFQKIASMFYISPYAMGIGSGSFHQMEVDYLPQDKIRQKRNNYILKMADKKIFELLRPKSNRYLYAEVSAHSLGTGRSKGCPTVGDNSETLATKAVIDWLGGRANAYNSSGKQVYASWSNGSVGMTGVSYNGTLPTMVATTGVEGLKAIVPIAAISNWYNYYRANGLVVSPGGYEGEDADVLAEVIVRKNACKVQLKDLSNKLARESGDYTDFWQARNYLPKVKNIKAATFIVHGQKDWNVKQRHAIELWHALEGVAPRRMFLHKRGHSSTGSYGLPQKISDWFDHHIYGDNNGIDQGDQVEVETINGSYSRQSQWPHEKTNLTRLYFKRNNVLAEHLAASFKLSFVDNGSNVSIESLAKDPKKKKNNRLSFLSNSFSQGALISGTAKVNLRIAVENRRASNLTVALFEYTKFGKINLITRGWADPQNYNNLQQGELLSKGQFNNVEFDLEPKQYQMSKYSKLGVLVSSTDKEYTYKPKVGTELSVELGKDSFVDLYIENLNSL